MNAHRGGPARLPGTYMVVFRCEAQQELIIGRLGALSVQPGFYLYVGSAFGPGGVTARVSRHLRVAVRRHWHVDYLQPALLPITVGYTHDPTRREHAWARALSGAPGVAPARPGFGASDCTCVSHLWFTAGKRQVDAALAAVASLCADFSTRNAATMTRSVTEKPRCPRKSSTTRD